MSTGDTSSELEKLRAEVAALKKAQAEEAAAQKAEAEAEVEARATERTETADAVEEDAAVKSQFEELADLLGEEIRDLPTITTLAVFTAGILLGRYLR